MVLYFLTSVSMITFFRRTQADTRPWHTLIAPVCSAVFIAGLSTLVLVTFDTLIGGSVGTAIALILTVALVLLLGVAFGRSRPTSPSAAQAPTGALRPESPSLPWPGLGTGPDEPTDVLPA